MDETPVQPPRDVYPVQHPTVAAAPERHSVENLLACGHCPAFQVTHRHKPFGQCLIAIQWLGAPLYRTDTDSCSMTAEEKAKAGYK